MLGILEPHIYGSTTLGAIEASGKEFAGYLGYEALKIFKGPAARLARWP